jgi:hypothetical protein
MPMVKIRIVGMRVPQRLVPVPMRMRLSHRPIVPMLMMLVMHMAVLVFEGFVFVLMFVPLR